MPDFPVMTPEEFEQKFPEIHRQVCDELGMGFVPRIFRSVVVANPELALASWNMVRNNLCAGSVPRSTKELMFTYVANKKQCNYCQVAHHALAVQHGSSGADVVCVLDDISKVQDPKEHAILEFTDLCVENGFGDAAKSYDKLTDLGFSTHQIGELIGMVSCAMYMVNIASSFGTSVDTLFIDKVDSAG